MVRYVMIGDFGLYISVDLRQDMLTLQVMRIMDSIWKKEGLDFLLNLYNCLPMGKNVGNIITLSLSNPSPLDWHDPSGKALEDIRRDRHHARYQREQLAEGVQLRQVLL